MDQYPQRTPPPENFPSGYLPSPIPGLSEQQGYPSEVYLSQQDSAPQITALPAMSPFQPETVPPYPGWGQPGYVPDLPRKRRAGLWISVAVLIVILLLGGGGFATYVILQNQSSAIATLNRFCDGLKTKNGQEIYDTLSASLQADPDNSEANIQKSFEGAGSVKITACSVSDVQQSSSTATAVMTITATADGVTNSGSGSLNLVKEHGEWKISSLPQLS